MKRRITRYALVSIALHAALLLLLSIVTFQGGLPRRPAVINAHLVPIEELGPSAPDLPADIAVAAEQSDESVVFSERETSEPREESDDILPPKPVSTAPLPDAGDSSPPHDAIAEQEVAEQSQPEQLAPAAASIQQTVPSERAPLTARSEPAPIVMPIPQQQQAMLEKRFSSLTERFSDAEAERSVSWQHDGREYTAQLLRQPGADSTALDQMIVKVSTEDAGQRLSTQMRLTRLGFSSFGQFVNRWDPDVSMHADEIDGRFHSNSEISIRYERGTMPVFRGLVTTAWSRVRMDGVGYVRRSRMFLSGVDTSVGRIPLPSDLEPVLDDAARDDRVQRFEDDTRITFYADGSYGWSFAESTQAEQRKAIPAGGYYIVGGKDAVLRVKGVVKGQVLVYSPRRIVIEDDVIYAHDPATTAGTTDLLGLVSDRVIEVAESRVTGPGDLIIHAAICAKRVFAVSGYLKQEHATLHIYGSLASGSVTATEPRFATRIRYDTRLKNLRPPGFPQTDRYELTAWDGAWKIE